MVLDVISELLDAPGKLGDSCCSITLDQMIRAEILIKRSVLQHVINVRQDRSRHGDGRLLRTPPRLETEELRLQVGPFRTRCASGTLDEHGFEPGCAVAHSRGAALAGAFIEPRREARP